MDTINDKRFKLDWMMLSQNQNITFDNIMDTINDKRFQWDWTMLSQNYMNKGREKYIKDMTNLIITLKSTNVFPSVIEDIINNYII